jgi:hypothetical protein
MKMFKVSDVFLIQDIHVNYLLLVCDIFSFFFFFAIKLYTILSNKDIGVIFT